MNAHWNSIVRLEIIRNEMELMDWFDDESMTRNFSAMWQIEDWKQGTVWNGIKMGHLKGNESASTPR